MKPLSTLQFCEEPPSPEIEKRMEEGFTEHALEVTGKDGTIKPYAITARDDGKLIGCCAFKTFWGALHIKSLWVDKNHRGQGLGKMLMEKALDKGKELGCPFAYVETMSFQALHFYQKLGFELDFTRKGYEGGTAFHYLTRKL